MRMKRECVGCLLAGAAWAAACAAESPAVRKWEVTPTSLVARGEPARQRIDVAVEAARPLADCTLKVYAEGGLLFSAPLGALTTGLNRAAVLLPEPASTRETRWTLCSGDAVLVERNLTWAPPRHWTLYGVKSSHVDIGLHDSQYKQRKLAVENIDQARALADQTAGWPDAARYRYVVEGLWWWQNYPLDRSWTAADGVVAKYVKPGLFGIGASHSGNRTETYGAEELCRSAYGVQQVRDRWGLPLDAMLMVDNNGITWPLVTAYADAGIRYLGYFPNAWNPKTVGGSRVDVGWDSKLPHLFYWQGPDRRSRLLVWADPHYIDTGHAFGIRTCGDRTPKLATPESVAPPMAKQLALLEARYPYDVWLVPNYDDNESPNLHFSELAKAWNARWRWPELRTVGDLAVPFREVERKFGDRIPTLSGTMTAGWAQHPAATPTLFALKRDADRRLPTAEKLAALARLADPAYDYPATAFRRAWDALVCNDEHGYGTSSYKGRPVYDTWIQKRDWIERAHATAEKEAARALAALASQVPAAGPSVFVFNPTLQPRAEIVEVAGRTFQTPEVPPLGYAVVPQAQGRDAPASTRPAPTPPTVENAFYRASFSADGALASLFDKALGRELIDSAAPYRGNQFVYTRDANKSFSSPASARFEIEDSARGQTVIARMDDPASGAAVEQRVTLLSAEKRVEIDNRLSHVAALAGTNRWYRFGYYAFPFAVPRAEFRVGLNGCAADPFKGQTGHGTDAYHAPRDWSHVGNADFGVTLVQADSGLVEFGRIHEKKNTFGERPANGHVYAYVFNNWLYGHAYEPGPSHMNLRIRFALTSHAGALRDSDAARFAERALTPLEACAIAGPQKGTLPAAPHGFLAVDAPNVELLALKGAEAPGVGVIARLHEVGGAAGEVGVKVGWGKDVRLTACSVTEQDRGALARPAVTLAPFGYATLRIVGTDTPSFAEPAAPAAGPSSAPAQVGSFYTGLIDAPRAWFGDTPDLLYLQWGQNREPDLSHYELCRGDAADFKPGEANRVALVQPGSYVTVPYEDRGLRPNTTYYYRVRAVNRSGAAGPWSDLGVGVTRELSEEEK